MLRNLASEGFSVEKCANMLAADIGTVSKACKAIRAYSESNDAEILEPLEYYLYKRTSRCAPDKKYSQSVDACIGIVTPNGVVESREKEDIACRDQGEGVRFSRAIWQLCPDGWKRPLGDDGEDVLSIIIRKWSPETYLIKERAIKRDDA